MVVFLNVSSALFNGWSVVSGFLGLLLGVCVLNLVVFCYFLLFFVTFCCFWYGASVVAVVQTGIKVNYARGARKV